MAIRQLGIITYQVPHLKTEQVMQRLLPRGYRMRMYALPFLVRKSRDVVFAHRPDQHQAVDPKIIAERHSIDYLPVDRDADIDDACDLYLVLGAGILSPECVRGKRIVNGHPGIIPASRGLDSFKWSIHSLKPLGNTLHYIDEQVDAGEVISVIPTNVYASDTLATLARRHYENEIDCLGRFEEYLRNPVNPFATIAMDEPHMRMPREKELQLEDRMREYAAKFGG